MITIIIITVIIIIIIIMIMPDTSISWALVRAAASTFTGSQAPWNICHNHYSLGDKDVSGFEYFEHDLLIDLLLFCENKYECYCLDNSPFPLHNLARFH